MEELNFLHPEIKKYCLEDYNLKKYECCVKKSFSLVRNRFNKKFENGDKVPKQEDFQKTYYIENHFNETDSKEDRNFRDGCYNIFRSINHFRNSIEHSKNNNLSIANEDVLYFMSLSSFALKLLEKTNLYTDISNPLSRDDYKNESMKGTIDFDYSNNNGVYRIGSKIYEFDINVSSCGENSLYLYNDSSNIMGVGLVEDNKKLSEIKEGETKRIDMSSRSRVIDTSNIGVLLNKNNKYALIKLKKATRDKNHQAIIDYSIFR